MKHPYNQFKDYRKRKSFLKRHDVRQLRLQFDDELQTRRLKMKPYNRPRFA